MIRRLVRAGVLFTVAFAVSARAAENVSAPRAKGFDGFTLTKNRNIFDPERRAMRTESRDSQPSQQNTSSRPDYIALTGTMVTPGKALAFFTGSRSDYNRVIPISEKLGDCTLVAIGGNQVELERKGKPVTLEVGKQLTLDDAGTISIATQNQGGSSSDQFRSSGDSRGGGERREGISSPTSGTATSPSTGTSPGAAPAPAATQSELLRRMMERRQKEINK